MRIRAGRLGGLLTILVLAAAVTPTEAHAQENEAKIRQATEAAPPAVAGEATIVDLDGTVLREGTNGWTCLPEAAPGGGNPMCNDEVWMKLLQALQSQSEFHTDRVGISYMLAGDGNASVNNADPFDTEQNEGETWVTEGPHLMLVLPDPAMLEGLPRDPSGEGPYVMWGGTPYAHVMVPVAPQEKM